MNLLCCSETLDKDDFQSRNTLHIDNGMMKSLMKQKREKPTWKHTTLHLIFYLFFESVLAGCNLLSPRVLQGTVDLQINWLGRQRCFSRSSHFSLPPQVKQESLSVAVLSQLAMVLMINPFAQVPCVSNPSPQDLFSHTCLSLQYFAEPEALILKSIYFLII